MLLFAFTGLQLLDGLTTLIFLQHGINEANPLVGALLRIFSHPALALAAPKLFAVTLGCYAWRTGRSRLLRRMNLVFALCVSWNLAAILLNAR
jgi:hypothetical protein